MLNRTVLITIKTRDEQIARNESLFLFSPQAFKLYVEDEFGAETEPAKKQNGNTEKKCFFLFFFLK